VLTRAIALTVVLACLQAVAGARQGPDTRPVLRYGLTSGVIENANPTDVRAASLVWVQGLSDLIGFYRAAEARLFPTAAEAVNAVNSGVTDVLALSTLEYFSVEKSLKASPALAFESAGEITVEYVLLARQVPGSLKEFAGKTVAVHAANRPWAMSEVWVDVLMADAGVADWRRTFSVRYFEKRGHSAMAVFFKQADLAIEVRSAFETSVELNPQLGRDLKVVARSPKLLPGVICLADRMEPGQRRTYIEKMSSMHELTKYRQAFNAMRLTRLVEWAPALLSPTRALVARQRAVQVSR
jgi:ABC-type phosphate/phosphonate transport system substrate-binding protein